MSAIKSDRQIIQKRGLKCIYWALIQSEYIINLPLDKLTQLEKLVETLLNSKDKGIANTSREVYKLIQ
jgi:hypothetical protein